MRNGLRFFLLFFFPFLVLTAAHSQGVCFGCSATYEFHDASLPPNYHRSFTIEVSINEAKLIVYNYHDTLLNEKFPVSNGKDFLMQLKNCNLKGKQLKNTGGCSGGTSESFFSDAGFNHESVKYKMIRLKIDAEVYHCGGKNYGSITGDVTGAVALFKSMIPDFEMKLAGTR